MKAEDWEALAVAIGAGSFSTEDESWSGRGGTRFARLALEEILGETQIVETVHVAVARTPGSELALDVLKLTRPRRAALECYSLYSKSRDLEQRRTAVWLLGHLRDPCCLNWLDEFLADDDAEVQAWGAQCLLELVFEDEVDDLDMDEWSARFGRHENPKVRALGMQIQEEASK